MATISFFHHYGRVLLVLCAITSICSCTQTISPYSSTFVDKTWVRSGYRDAQGYEEYTIASSTNTPYHIGGFSLKSNGEFIHYANDGWCGTPLIIAEFRGGKWASVNDSTFNIEASYWGTRFELGKQPNFLKYTMIITASTSDKIKVYLR